MKSVRTSDGLRRAHQILTASYADNSGGLTVPQTAVLRAVSMEGPMNQREIVDATGIDRSTLSDLLRRLVRDGKIISVRMEDNQRTNQITITKEGRTALGKASNAMIRAEAAVLALAPTGERQAFLRCLQAIARDA